MSGAGEFWRAFRSECRRIEDAATPSHPAVDLEVLLTRAANARRWPPRWRVPNTPAPPAERRSVSEFVDDTLDWFDEWEGVFALGLLAACAALLACVVIALLAAVFL